MATNPFQRSVQAPLARAPSRRFSSASHDVVIFDLDDTLSSTEWRARHLDKEKNGGKARWDVFFENCRHDPPMEEMMLHAKRLSAAGVKLVFFTGRPEGQRENTMAWLAEQGLECFHMRMRPRDSFIPDDKLKTYWTKDLLEMGHRILCAFDDRERNRVAFMAFGILTADPARPDEAKAVAAKTLELVAANQKKPKAPAP